jgi:Protein of unknown function (DUF1501)
VQTCDGLTRRDFLRVGAAAAGAVGLSLADLTQLQQASASGPAQDINCILLFLLGGPSQLDTWDLKPEAPDNVRGPFRPAKTNVPGIHIGEHFPRLATMTDRFALIRSVHHREAPIHETGHQLMQTGKLSRGGLEHPHYGAVVSHLRGPGNAGSPAFVVLPGPVGNTGVSVSHGQSAGYLGSDHEPFWMQQVPAEASLGITAACTPDGSDLAQPDNGDALVAAVDQAERGLARAEDNGQGQSHVEWAYTRIFSPKAKQAFRLYEEKDDLRSRYGMSTFGQSCLAARRLVEGGVRLVTVNMFDTVFNRITWDCHADGGSLATTLDDYRDTLCPMFDRACSALLEDLRQRGLLDTTLVVAMGEFGRTPYLNPRGGRDHWPGCWTILFAGAGVRGGQVIGSSDPLGAEPKDRPVTPAEVAASVYHGLGIDLKTRLSGPDSQALPLVEAEPVYELFAG